jgi:hypothetical protein
LDGGVRPLLEKALRKRISGTSQKAHSAALRTNKNGCGTNHHDLQLA